jgi:DNA-binding CsgD family transcriptional regulator/tetratricopeptide (TPR) repeat protein
MADRGAEELVRDGLEALAAADWDTARSFFEQAQEVEPSPEALNGLSEVANFQGEYERSIELKEEAFREFRSRNQPIRAADVARWLAFMYATYNGNYSVASGWMGRAASLMEGVPESAAHGWLVLDRAPFSRDPAERQQLATAALTIAQRYGDTDLEFEAVALLGESYVASGRIDEGMALLDQAMAAITSREIADHKVMGEIYCRLLSACEQALDVRRAEEWVAAVDRYIVWHDFVRPTCRTHYGGILVALGRWTEAETELVAAIEAFERGYRGDRAFPLIRLAELRVRQGRFEEAERLLEGHEWHPTARRAAAAIACGRGNLELAEELARMCFEGADPSDPACGPALELLVVVQVASGDLVAARETRDRLHALAAATGSDRLEAVAELASGLAGAGAGDEGATSHFKRALETFAGLQLPLEAARCRLELARALAPRQPDAAVYEGRLALQAFEQLGASRDADAAAEVLRGIGAPGRAWPKGSRSLTKREREVLGLLAEGLANAQIADRLFISVRTAEHHVANILGKLDLRSRAEAAAYALREGSRKEP